MTTAPSKQPAGVMDASYARDRRRKPHLLFRLRSRAYVACKAYHRFAPHTQPPRLLDLSAAEGATLVEMHSRLRAIESIGIEYAQELIDEASPMPPGCRLLRGDVTQPHPQVLADSFDLVTSLAVIEHLSEPSLMMTQVRRALRPGGVFVASCPVGLWDQCSGLLHLHPEEHHEDRITRRRFEQLAQQAGLQPLQYRLFMFAPIGFLPYLRLPVSPALADALDVGLHALKIVNWGFVNQLFVARKPV